MGEGRTNFHRSFAGVSLGFVLLAACVVPCPEAAAATNTAAKREAASSQFSRAQEMRAALNEKPPEKRTLADYKRVVTTYQRVYLITPHAVEVPDSLVAMGELNTEMGDRFGRSYYQAAAESYQFLIHEYPANKFVQDAMLRVGQLQKDQLGDPAAATKTFQDFQKKFPRSTHKREVQEALAELALMKKAETGNLDAKTAQPAPAPVAPAKTVVKEEAAQPVARTSGNTSGGEKARSVEVPRIQHIRSSVTPDGTEVIIELEDMVQYVSGRIANPDRIYFDLHAAKLSPSVAHNKIHVSGELLSQIRVAQNQGGVVRVVLDVNGVKDYAASLMHKPSRLVIELYGMNGAHGAAVQTAKTAAPAPVMKGPSNDAADKPATTETFAAYDPPPNVVTQPAEMPEKISLPPAPAPAKPIPAPVKVLNTKSTKTTAGTKPDLVQPAVTPQPTRDGQSTLTRTLGLKIGRIVIDAGHGGHDTGTIGPTGLMEKDLCLDVALRLGKLIQQKLPGADIVFTRSDDTFIPLEERTRIANEAKADLFISIHANSSPDHGARGIETYYLNLKGSPEAMAVAARENAVSQQGIHDLEDLVKKIARTEKIDESRELAEDVQESLAKRVQKTARPVKDRGVRKAPFVVLIGADMPSILTEISFLSNPSDEQLLKKPEHRQRVAEGLYQGVSDYLQSMNSVAVNRSSKPGRPAAVPVVEQSRNQQ
ncbi:MAG TPA: N-acetylmuramoyl-L-alanine amidase [Candidatus Acidoferrum sp.]|nr:N-acetylmuramoyl-L-alanine amidase [Candidatus Acidoferrum sp.]